MTDPFQLRGAVDLARLELDNALANADNQLVEVRRLQDRLAAGEPPNTELKHGVALEGLFRQRESTQNGLRAEVAQREQALAAATGDLRVALDAGPALFADGNTDPIALLPVRLETRFRTADARAPEPGAGGRRTILVRVYPDDLHVEMFEPELTPDEAEAARAYWRACWGAASEDPRRETAWRTLTARLRPKRAQWAVEVLRPVDLSSPEPIFGTPPLRPPDRRRPPRASTLPARWRFLGLTGGAVVVDQTGRDIPDPLPLGVLPHADGPGTEAGWLVEFPAAVEVGMAAELTLPSGVDRLDRLIVVGVRQDPPLAAATRLQAMLHGHRFESGLGFLRPGTPTNNTPQTGSGWSAQADVPAPPLQRASIPPDEPEPADEPAPSAAAVVVVQSGDTVSGLAAGLGVEQARFVEANAERFQNRSIDQIEVGERLAIPAGAGTTWTVIAGDTLTRIAARFDLPDFQVLLQLNAERFAGQDPNLINVGEQLLVAGPVTTHPIPGLGSTPEARLGRALGLPDPAFLAAVPGAGDGEDAAVAGLALLSWRAFGQSWVQAGLQHFNFGTRELSLPAEVGPWPRVRDHLVRHVRSRGPLPTLRIGRQPYGVLPVSSLDDWRPAGPDEIDAVLLPWLLRLRHQWRAAVEMVGEDWVPRVGAGQPADRFATDALSRLPVAADLLLRRMRAPFRVLDGLTWDRSGPALSVGGVGPDTALRWSTLTDEVTDLGADPATKLFDPELLRTRLNPDPPAAAQIINNTRDYLAAVLDVLERRNFEEYLRAWPLPELTTMPAAGVRRTTLYEPFAEPEPDILCLALDLTGTWLLSENVPDPLSDALAAPSVIDRAVRQELESPQDPDIPRYWEFGRRAAPQLRRLVRALGAIGSVAPDRLLPLLLEVLDVHSHRLDAWITSLATRRLTVARARGATGVRLGGYGFVENLGPAEPTDTANVDGVGTVSISPADGYVHAPSLHHAATAAVLRSGYLAHPGEDTFAVNLTSRRARVAQWLLAGVRRGQHLGALLGYRFERALHDAELDFWVEEFRRRFPTPMTPEPAAGGVPGTWERSSEAIAANNVVDGMLLLRELSLDSAAHVDRVAGARTFNDLNTALATLAPAHPDLFAALAGRVPPDLMSTDQGDSAASALLRILAELADALDAVADLVLAESVHQLVGGNPMRAGLAADTLGRGEGVPDRFDVLRTPHRGRAVTHRVAVAMPVTPTRPGGWAADPLSELEPRLDAWVAQLLGPAQRWRLTGTLRIPGGDEHAFDRSAAELGLGALTVVLDVASGDHRRLDRRIATLELGAEATPAAVTYTGSGWRGLRGLALRIRTLLATAGPLQPAHLRPPTGDGAAGPSGAQPDLGELRERVARFLAPVAAALGDLEPNLEGPGRTPESVASALERLAASGVSGYPDPVPSSHLLTAGSLVAQRLRPAVERLAKVLAEPLDAGWPGKLREPMGEMLGVEIPLAPLLGSIDDAPLRPGTAPAGSAEIVHWLARHATVRPAVRAWYETVAVVDALGEGACPLVASQHPAGPGGWIGARFDNGQRPAARQHVVWHQPGPIPAAAPVAGFVLDEWVEILPGTDALANPGSPPDAELTGLVFHFDRPDAKAPQAVLLAVPPDLERGWTPDGLAQVIVETLELAKLRAVDLGDLPLLDDLAPAAQVPDNSDLEARLTRLESELQG